MYSRPVNSTSRPPTSLFPPRTAATTFEIGTPYAASTCFDSASLRSVRFSDRAFAMIACTASASTTASSPVVVGVSYKPRRLYE